MLKVSRRHEKRESEQWHEVCRQRLGEPQRDLPAHLLQRLEQTISHYCWCHCKLGGFSNITSWTSPVTQQVHSWAFIPGEMATYIHTKICTWVFIAASFPNQQLEITQTSFEDESSGRWWPIQAVGSHPQETKIALIHTTWMGLRRIVRQEKKAIWKQSYSMTLSICHFEMRRL